MFVFQDEIGKPPKPVITDVTCVTYSFGKFPNETFKVSLSKVNLVMA